MQTLWGIDLGGTKCELIVLEWPTKRILFRKRIPTQRDKGYLHILNGLLGLVTESSRYTRLSPTKIGAGTPGCLDSASGVMKNCNTTQLNGMPLKKDLEKIFGVPTIIENDANCFALAETRLGSVAQSVPDARVVWGLIMGTGVGSGIVVDGNILHGKHGIAGEWGHNFLDSSGGKCYCGRTGCVETVISGIALENFYKVNSGKTKSLKEIEHAASRKDDMNAIGTMARLYHNFGKAVASVINVLDPDAIVIGGGLGNIDELYKKGPIEIQKHLFNSSLNTPILKPLLGDSAGVYGAALLCLDQNYN